MLSRPRQVNCTNGEPASTKGEQSCRGALNQQLANDRSPVRKRATATIPHVPMSDVGVHLRCQGRAEESFRISDKFCGGWIYRCGDTECRPQRRFVAHRKRTMAGAAFRILTAMFLSTLTREVTRGPFEFLG
jgi:hypothetical protein